MIGAVIFDWNGTLYDDLEDKAYGSLKYIYQLHNLPAPTLKDYRTSMTVDFIDFYYKHGFTPNFSGKGREGDIKVINDARKKYYDEHKEMGRVRPDALRSIIALRSLKIQVGIVSGEVESILLANLNAHNIRQLFDYRLIRAEVWRDKGNDLIEICDKMNVLAGDAIYVDDTLHGTAAANKAGLISVGFANETAYNSRDTLCKSSDYIIQNFSDLPSLVDIINIRRSLTRIENYLRSKK